MSTPPLILHIPHASTHIPPEQRARILLNDADLHQETLCLTDMHTDTLYDSPGACRVVFPVSRLVVDAERFADDDQEIMSPRGMGVIYTKTSQEKELRRPPDAEERKYLLEKYYYPHHTRLSTVTEGILDKHGYAVIMDCHSFSSTALPYERQPPGSIRPEICIGTDPFHTPEWMAQAMLNCFSGYGYSVARDTPFAGALTPARFYHKDPRVYALMIEVRKDVYMDELTGSKMPAFNTVKEEITQAIEKIMFLCRKMRPA